MNQRLQRSEQVLQRAHDELETRVEERTAELVAVNKALQMEIVEHKRMEQRIEGLNRLKEDLLRSGSLDEKLKRITDGVITIFDADFARIWIIQRGDLCDSGCFHAKVTDGPHVCRYRDHCLCLKASSGRYTHIDGEVHRRVPFGCYKIGRVAAGKDPKFITTDVTHDPRVHDHDWASKLGLVSFAGYRLLSAAKEPIGVLALFSQHVISPDEDALLEGLANSTAQVIQTAEAEEALAASESRLRSTLASMDDLVFVFDEQGRFVHYFASTEDLYVTPEEFLGKKHAEVMPSHVDELFAQAFDKNRMGETAEYEYEFRTGSETGWYSTKLSPMFLGGEFVGSVAVLRDITERVQAEDVLRESEERYRSLFANNHSIMLLIDPKTADIVDANPAACSFYGHSQEELTKKKITDINLLSREQILHEIDRARSEERQHFLFRHRLAHGEIRDVEVYSGPIRIHGRQLLHSIIHDVTKRVQVEEALQQSRSNLQMLFDSLDDFLFVLDMQGNILRVNPVVLERLGYSEQELLGKSMLQVHPPERHEEATVIVAEMIAGQVSLCTVPIMTKDGTRIPVETRISRGYWDGQEALFGISRDISEQVLAEERLKASQQRLALALEASGAGMYDHTIPIGPGTYHSERWAEILGYKLDELPPLDRFWPWLLDQIHPDDFPYLEKMYDDFVEGRSPSYYAQVRMRHKSGQWIHVETLSQAVERDENGHVTRNVGVMLDITERKRVEVEREKLISELEDSLARVKTLSGLLPICASCKKIRDDQGYWTQVEVYVRDHTEAEFSHGLCPECVKKLYPNFVLSNETSKEADP